MRENSGTMGFDASFRFIRDAALQKDYSSRRQREALTVKIERDEAAGRNTFTGYGDGYVEVNRARHTESLVVGGDRLIADWPAAAVESLSADHMAAIVELKPQIVLLGTGATFRFVEPA